MKKYMQPATCVVEIKMEGFVASSPEIANELGDEGDFARRQHGSAWSSELWSGAAEE